MLRVSVAKRGIGEMTSSGTPSDIATGPLGAYLYSDGHGCVSGPAAAAALRSSARSVRRLGELADAKAWEGGDGQGALVAAEERDEPLATQPHVRLDAAEVGGVPAVAGGASSAG